MLSLHVQSPKAGKMTNSPQYKVVVLLTIVLAQNQRDYVLLSR